MSRGRAQTLGDLFSTEQAPLPPGAKAPKPRGKRRGEDPENLFWRQCREYGLPLPLREHEFAKIIGRRWRFDFAFHEYQLAVEIEGIVVTRAIVGATATKAVIGKKFVDVHTGGQERLVSMGRHAHADGFREDCRKYATAAELGWTVIRFDPKLVKTKEAIERTMRCLIARGWKNPGAPES